MPNWKILITDGLAESGQEILKVGADITDQSGISAEALLDKIQTYEALIVRGRTQVTQDVIEAASNLQVIGRAGVGVNHSGKCSLRFHHCCRRTHHRAYAVARATHRARG